MGHWALVVGKITTVPLVQPERSTESLIGVPQGRLAAPQFSRFATEVSDKSGGVAEVDADGIGSSEHPVARLAALLRSWPKFSEDSRDLPRERKNSDGFIEPLTVSSTSPSVKLLFTTADSVCRSPSVPTANRSPCQGLPGLNGRSILGNGLKGNAIPRMCMPIRTYSRQYKGPQPFGCGPICVLRAG